jgi:hypothetical protein
MMRYLLRLRAWIRPDVRGWLDGLGVFLAVTLFFCLLQSAHDDIAKRNRDFGSQRWWYPTYRPVHLEN